jgi:predicted Ser/Thr protein kinase
VTRITQANPSLLAPRFFPGLRVEQVLGSGGYGTAYQGKWHDTNVVLKVQDYQLNSPE